MAKRRATSAAKRRAYECLERDSLCGIPNKAMKADKEMSELLAEKLPKVRILELSDKQIEAEFFNEA